VNAGFTPLSTAVLPTPASSTLNSRLTCEAPKSELRWKRLLSIVSYLPYKYFLT
jgi:hypothetical protein